MRQPDDWQTLRNSRRFRLLLWLAALLPGIVCFMVLGLMSHDPDGDGPY